VDELKRIENETLPQVRDVWLEHFLERTKCPRCNKPLNHFDGKTWCEDCGLKIEY
jgi:predicted amidophosphoribosyltransferase